MNELNHWQPVQLSKDVKQRPVTIKLCGQEIALFRTQNGEIGALEDSCPHRGMRLSNGWVNGNKLVCPYHGWNYGTDGTGYSCSTQNLRLCAKSFDVLEKYGLVWVKATGYPAQIPNIDYPNYNLVCILEHHINAPLECLVDANSEIEHAALVHTFFGHSLSQVSEVEVKFDFSDSEVTRLAEKMPQKKLPRLLEKLFSVNSRDHFFDNIEIHFSPIYKTSQLYWENEKTGQRRKEKLRSVYFFTPVNDQETKWISLYYITAPRWGILLYNLLQKPILTAIMKHEGNREKKNLESLSDKHLELDQMCLGRLDQAITKNRERIKRIYRGQKQTLVEAE